MINDGVLITANNWPSAWRPRGKEEAPRRALQRCTTVEATRRREMPGLIKKSH